MYSATKNEALKREHGSRFASISEALFKTDPAHVNFETNPDEYESEVVAIIRRLSSAQSAEDVQTILHEELVRTLWDVGVSIDALPSLAAEIWKLWGG